MSILDKVKSYFTSTDITDYSTVLAQMNDKLKELIDDYNKLLDMQNRINADSKILLDTDFSKKDKYIDQMENIKYKDENIIKEYNLYAMKYNILVDLLKKVKKYILSLDANIKIKFEYDQIGQPIAIASHNEGDLHKIALIKNTLSKEQYIKYKKDTDIQIVDISAFEYVYHLERLIEEIGKIKQSNIVIKEILFKNLPKTNKDIIKHCGWNIIDEYSMPK